MTKQEIIEKLRSDLANEFHHMHFYLECAAVVKGFHRAEYREFFLEQAQSEMKHVDEFHRLIIGLGGNILNIGDRRNHIEMAFFKGNIIKLLQKSLELEDGVVSNYVKRIDDAVALQKNGGSDAIDGKYIELFLEDQILHSREDADHIREMLNG